MTESFKVNGTIKSLGLIGIYYTFYALTIKVHFRHISMMDTRGLKVVFETTMMVQTIPDMAGHKLL